MENAYPNTIPAGLDRQFKALQFADHLLGRDQVDRLFASYRERLRERILQTLPERAADPIPVDRRRHLSREDFIREYRDPGIPVVLEGAAADWACCQNWSIDEFRRKYGKDEVLLNDHRQDFKDGHSDDLHLSVTTLGEALTTLSPETYVRFYPLFSRHPETAQDIDLEWLESRVERGSFGQHYQFFVGGKGGHTPYHHAAAGNLFIQIEGRKEWRLIPASNSAYLDPQCRYGISRGPTIAADNEIYTRLTEYHLHLEAGDILWNPPHMWHTVTNLTHSLAVGYRWFSIPAAMRASALYTTSDLTQTNPPIWKLASLAKEEISLVALLMGIKDGRITDPKLIAYAEKYRN